MNKLCKYRSPKKDICLGIFTADSFYSKYGEQGFLHKSTRRGKLGSTYKRSLKVYFFRNVQYSKVSPFRGSSTPCSASVSSSLFLMKMAYTIDKNKTFAGWLMRVS